MSSSGIVLSSDMLSQGKYDETAPQAKTGKTGQETVASLSRDTAKAQTAAVKQDAQAMQQTVEAERAIKQAAVAEAVKFSDEAYRKLFIEKHPMFEVMKDKDGNTIRNEKTNKPLLRELSEQEKTNLQPGSDGKVHISTNGIFNGQDAAGTYANQHNTTKSPQYVIYFPEADNVVSELMVAGYQKYMESTAMGLSNSTVQVRDAMNQYGQTGLQLDGHSRGAMTIGNGLESRATSPNAQGSLSNTTINFFGPAYNARQADNLLSTLQDRASLPAAQQPNLVLQLQNHAADPVGVLIGGNPSTGGTIPKGSSPIKEAFKAVTMRPTTVHNCYGLGPTQCQQLWQDLPKQQPLLLPIQRESIRSFTLIATEPLFMCSHYQAETARKELARIGVQMPLGASRRTSPSSGAITTRVLPNASSLLGPTTPCAVAWSPSKRS